MLFFFFFQAEDGIRDIGVTGVQTCALPIYTPRDVGRLRALGRSGCGGWLVGCLGERLLAACTCAIDDRVTGHGVQPWRAGPALRAVAAGGAPDRGEGLLHGVLGAAPVAEQAQ